MRNEERIRRFTSLIKLYRERENALVQRLRAAQAAHAREATQLDNLDSLRGEYRERLDEAAEAGVTGAALKNWRRFIHGLDNLRHELSEREQRTARATDLRKGEWLSQRSRVKGLESLDGKWRADRAAALARAEQKRQDEIAGRTGKP